MQRDAYFIQDHRFIFLNNCHFSNWGHRLVDKFRFLSSTCVLFNADCHCVGRSIDCHFWSAPLRVISERQGQERAGASQAAHLTFAGSRKGWQHVLVMHTCYHMMQGVFNKRAYPEICCCLANVTELAEFYFPNSGIPQQVARLGHRQLHEASQGGWELSA